MNSVLITSPEVKCCKSLDEESALVRRILFVVKRDKESCIPTPISITSEYPAAYIQGMYKCYNLNCTINNELKTYIYLTPEFTTQIINNLHPDFLENDVKLLGHISTRDKVVLYIPLNSLSCGSTLDFNAIDRPVDLTSKELYINGKFEFRLRFSKCIISGSTTCYNIDHLKSWTIEAECIYGTMSEPE